MSTQEDFQNDAIRFRDADVRVDVEQRTEPNDRCSLLARLLRCCYSCEKRLEVRFGLREIIDRILIELGHSVAIIT